MPLKVIGAGFGRTGTLSMKAAFERLGFDPCYHFVEVIEPRPGYNDGHRKAWVDFMKGRRAIDWHRLFERYEAVLDLPMCLYYRELMEAFPEARVVLTVRRCVRRQRRRLEGRDGRLAGPRLSLPGRGGAASALRRMRGGSDAGHAVV